MQIAAVAVLAAALAGPATAEAHGIVGQAGLPVPAWLFAWAAGLVLAGSFAALPRLWSAPRLEHAPGRPLRRLSARGEALLGAAGIAAFALLVIAGFAGNRQPARNLAPTAVFVLFWVATPILAAVSGNRLAALNPWRAIARAAAVLARRAGLRAGAPLEYPQRLGRWPAVVGVLSFGWLELVDRGRDDPATLALLAVVYALVQLVGMAAYGVETWSQRADAFSVAFGLVARISPLRVEDGVLVRRAPLSALAELEGLPGTVPLLCVMIGVTTFDGASNGPLWRSISHPLLSSLLDAGLDRTAALELTGTFGLLLAVAICGGLYAAGISGMAASETAGDPPARRLAGSFVHTLVPIALGYLVAHYFSLLVVGVQAAVQLASDPLGTGSDLLGTASWAVDPRAISSEAIWYVQVAALIAGHVAALALAHDRALVVFRDPNRAALSQRWMLVVMVGFTSLGLWLLSAVNT